MPFNSRAYRILIASPSDVEEEREIAVRVIQEWNDLYSDSRSVVLLPLRWETHSAPEYGTRPQEVINRAVVDQCDLLIGVLWTRIGTPTGAAESGTLEEIARVAKAGKPIMLYFSKVAMEPDRIDVEQLNKLKAFKADVYPNALTESYKSHIEFRDKLAKQLELKVRELQRADVSGEPPPLSLSIASRDLKSLDGPSATRTVEAVEVVDLDTGLGADPKMELRRAIEAYVERSAATPIVLAISNAGSSGIRNLYVEIEITGPSPMSITDKEPQSQFRGFRAFPWTESIVSSWYTNYEEPAWSLDIDWEKSPDLREGFTKTDTGWRLTFEWAALQPRRQRLVVPALFVKAQTNGTVRFLAKVFADSLPEPVSLEAKLELAVRERKVKVGELFRKVEKLVAE